MKIAFFTDSYLPTINGVSIAVDFTYRNLLKRKHNVFLVIPKTKDHKLDQNTSGIFSIVVNKAFNYRFSFITPRIFNKLLKMNLDIIHGHAAGPISLSGLILARLKKIPYVYTYHTMMADYAHYVPLRLIRPKMIDRIVKISCNQCDCVIAPSEKVKKELISLGVSNSIKVIPTGIEVNKFNIAKQDFLRNKFNLQKDNSILLHTGRLGKEKSVDFLIHAFKLVHEQSPKTHFVIVGGGPQLDFLKTLSKKLNIEKNVHFTGLIKPIDMPLVYNSADIFMFSSQTETQGLVVLEAMASGLPMVVVEDEALMETLNNNVNGIIVKKDEKIYAKEVLRLLEDEKERRRLGESARKKAVLISKGSIEKLEDIYKTLISKTQFS